MGGKGRRRREKNYRAAHGVGNSRLPPPPDPSSIDALPSKLRKLMSIPGALGLSFNPGKNRGIRNDKEEGANLHKKRKRNALVVIPESTEIKQDISHIAIPEETKKRKKGQKAHDFRFDAISESVTGISQRKQRKKQRLEERKKKNKRTKTDDDDDDDADFPGHEEVRFGDVVKAPPKLFSLPKRPLKTTQNASQERLRLRAVETYRERKKWTSRPGIQLPKPPTAIIS